MRRWLLRDKLKFRRRWCAASCRPIQPSSFIWISMVNQLETSKPARDVFFVPHCTTFLPYLLLIHQQYHRWHFQFLRLIIGEAWIDKIMYYKMTSTFCAHPKLGQDIYPLLVWMNANVVMLSGLSIGRPRARSASQPRQLPLSDQLSQHVLIFDH